MVKPKDYCKTASTIVRRTIFYFVEFYKRVWEQRSEKYSADYLETGSWAHPIFIIIIFVEDFTSGIKESFT